MKILLLAFLLASNLQANDGGIYYLDVQGIKNKKINTEDNYFTKVLLEFEGKDAAIFAKSLPKALDVMPEVTEYVNRLALVDQKSNRIIFLACSKGDFDIETNQFKLYGTTKCSISLEVRPVDPEANPAYQTSTLDGLVNATKLEAPVACLQK